MKIDNEIMIMNDYMLIEMVLLVSKPIKQVQVCSNNHKHKLTTQHVNAITLATKNFHNIIAKHNNGMMNKQAIQPISHGNISLYFIQLEVII